ncbi:MAG: hypothetical protein QOF71_2935 [Candidatus Eremiobacteraeota bacterium]|nr:hypothetical protein [Candidatus Eremiobacteraeota bacterium]
MSGILDLRQLSAKRFDIDGLHADRIDAIGLALSKSASFDRIEIKDQVDLTNARIGCLLAMRAAAIGDDLYFGNADIRGLDLSGTTVVDALFLDGTFIRGDLTALGGAFSNCECSAKILGSVRITDATFNVARFVDIRVQKGVYFNRNAVSGTLTIESRGTVMATVGERCTFGGTRIGGQILIRDIEIKGQLSMVSLTATDIIFRNVRIGKEMNLTGASATLGMTLRSCVVGLSVDLQSISTTSLNVSESSCESISAEGANIKGSATFESVDLLDLSAVHAQINATLKLSGARIARSLDLSRAEVGNLEFGSDLEDPPETYSFPKRVVLRNCKYGSLQGQWRTLLARLEGATAYDSTAYLALEDFMRSRGRSDWADSVYLSSKTHAAKMLQSGAKRFAQSVLEWISGYGARPFRLLRAFAIIVATVAFILFVTPQLYPRLLIHSREPFGVLLMRACFTTLDVLVKGDRSAIFTQASGARSSMALQAILDVVAILRYTALAVFTLWLAYITGLVRYVGTRG